MAIQFETADPLANGSDAISYLTGQLQVTQTQLAKAIGVSKGRITDVKSGRDKWPADWTPKVNSLPKGEVVEPEPEPSEIAVPNPHSNMDSVRIEFAEHALVLPSDVAEAEWIAAAEKVARASRAVQWWIGDAWNAFKWGDKRAAMEAAGINAKTAETYAQLARSFPPEARVEGVSFLHHQIVYKRDDATDLLVEAKEQGMSVSKLRDQIRDPDVEPRQKPSERIVELEQELIASQRTIKDLREQIEMNPPEGSLAAMKARYEEATRKLQSRVDKLTEENRELRAQLEKRMAEAKEAA